MADKNVSLEASDIFSLGGNFIPQSTTKTRNVEYATMIKANGDWQVWSGIFNGIDNISATYKYSDVTGLGAALPNVGHVSNSYLITEISLSTIYNDYPTISITGHQHTDNTHVDGMTEYAIPADMTTAPLFTGQYGAYDWAGLAAGDVCATDSTYTLSMEHQDQACADGDHWVGANLRGKEVITVNYVGVLAAYPAVIAGWTVTATALNDSNSEFDKSTVTAERIVLRV